MKRTAIVMAVLLGAMLASCNDPESPVPKKTSDNPPQFADLSAKDHVVQNLVAAYLQRDIDEYKRLLDTDYYRFFFSDDDVQNGLPMDGWSRAQDETATANLLNPNNPAPNRILSIDLTVEQDSLVWESVKADTASPDSTWMSATTTYDFTMRAANDFTYLTHGTLQVQFIVRNIGTDSDPQWRLVRWRDIGSTGFAAAASAASSAVEETNWGRVKSLYSN